MAIHKDLTGADAIHEIMYVQSSDPGAVGANKFWIDTTAGATFEAGAILKQRNGADSAWTTRADIKTALDLKAALASPTFTGTPAAPTASPGTNSTQVATTAFVTAAVAAQGGGDALTANPLSQFAATTSAQLAGVISDETGSGVLVFGTAPTLSNPVVGTQTAGDNSTKAASTAYVDNAVAKQKEVLAMAVSDETTALTTGTAKLTFRMPFAMTLTSVRGSLTTASSSGNPAIDINESGASIFSTTLTIDSGEKTSTTAATPAVISDSSLADDAEMTVDIDTAGTGAAGLKIYLIGTRT